MLTCVVVGSGLSGLFSANLAADSGARVLLVSQGRGGLSLSHGCIGFWSRGAPSRSLPRLRSAHPYGLAGYAAAQMAIERLTEMCGEYGYPISGSLSRNYTLPTALGGQIRVSFAPRSLAQGELREGDPFTLGQLPGFRDYHAGFLAARLDRTASFSERVVDLPISSQSWRADYHSADIGRLFEDPSWRAETLRSWKPLLTGTRRLGLPAVLGCDMHMEILNNLEERLECTVFEIPTPPPSLPGIRLERILRRRAIRLGVEIIEGPKVIGRVDGMTAPPKVTGVVLDSQGIQRFLHADIVILATGGVLNGGLRFRRNGLVQESVFDLPVKHVSQREAWVSSQPLREQPYDRFGVAVNEAFQPVAQDGSPFFDNVFAVGGLLTGASRCAEGSRQGIDLVSAFRAVEVALG